jgi:hypothetical protein
MSRALPLASESVSVVSLTHSLPSHVVDFSSDGPESSTNTGSDSMSSRLAQPRSEVAQPRSTKQDPADRSTTRSVLNTKGNAI